MKKVLLVVTIMALFITGCGKKQEKKQDDKKGDNAVVENNKTVKSFDDQTIDEILISDFNLNFVDNVTNAYAKVKNTKKEDIKIEQIDATLTDKDGRETKTLFYIGKTLKAGEELQLQTSITGNVATSTKVEYKIQY